MSGSLILVGYAKGFQRSTHNLLGDSELVSVDGELGELEELLRAVDARRKLTGHVPKTLRNWRCQVRV